VLYYEERNCIGPVLPITGGPNRKPIC